MRTAQLFTMLLLAAVYTAAGETAHAATYFVATAGSDAAAGTQAAPFKTITYAYSRATAGDTILVMPGVYYEAATHLGVRMHKSGTADRPITLRSALRWGAIIDGRNLKDAPQVLVYMDGHHNVLEGFELRNSSKEGVMVRGTYNKVLNNHVHSNGNYGDLTSPYGHDGIYSGETAKGTLYAGNYVHHNGRLDLVPNHKDHGMYLSGDNEAVINNISVHNMTHGIQVRGAATVSNMLIANNVFAHNGEAGIMLYQAMDGITIRNNILYRNRRYAVESYAATGSGVVIDTNIVHGNGLGQFYLRNSSSTVSVQIGTNSTTNPLFVNEASDFRLSATSPGIDTGAALSAVMTDFDGLARPQGRSHDIGPYEFASAVLQPPAAPTDVIILTN